MMGLNIIQLNMGRGAAVNDQLLHFAQHNAVDIALVQEPYTRRGLLSGLETAPLRRVLSRGSFRPGSSQLVFGAAIVVFNPKLVVTARPDLCDENIAVATLELETGERVNLISASNRAIYERAGRDSQYT